MVEDLGFEVVLRYGLDLRDLLVDQAAALCVRPWLRGEQVRSVGVAVLRQQVYEQGNIGMGK